VFEQTGLSSRLQTFVPNHAKAVFFPGDKEPTWIHRDPTMLDKELAQKWGERGEVKAFRADEAAVVRFLQDGYANARPPSIADANAAIGETLTELWISGSARNLTDHYFTSERSKMYMAMTVTESGPVSLDDPYSAFTLPMMDSGSIFDGYYGFVKGGIWQITAELGRINDELGINVHLSSSLVDVDSDAGRASWEQDGQERSADFDYLVLATDPLTASRLVGDADQLRKTEAQRFRGSSGKLNVMFKNPIRWKHGSGHDHSDAAFRFVFSVKDIDEYEAATLKVLETENDYVPGYMQIYCEGAAMRQLNHNEPFDRLAVFFKNLSLSRKGADLANVEQQVKGTLFEKIENPEDCVWTRLLMPKDLQELFLFPGGNLDHTMLTGGQTYFDRGYSDDPSTAFYRYGGLENVYVCGSGTYPCGSIAGTPGYMCSQQLLRAAGLKP
ncbi:MAG: hypothetical protein OEM63_10950, partial [Gammaproteobacteria bacterium]|nr:hypothetical protein [Gammaproteobacteria bacterium]